jgi:AcrR family transcriptional regulator
MPGPDPPAARRTPRADARRNRERILALAKEAFTHSGPQISLDELARQAGVGAGTLYRHFPTRGDLLEAVYREEVERLVAAEVRLAEALPPIEALRAWLLLFVDYIATKQIVAAALETLLCGPSSVFEASGVRITGAIEALVRRAVRGGDLRSDLDPIDLLRALIGVANVASGPDWPANARRLVEILLAGARPAGTAAALPASAE